MASPSDPPMTSLISRPDGLITENLGNLVNTETIADVIIHCRGQVKLKANKLILVQSSKLFKTIFERGCQCECYTGMTYDVLCLDFEPETVRQVLNLLYTGQASVDSVEDYKSLHDVLHEFNISLELTDSTNQSGVTILNILKTTLSKSANPDPDEPASSKSVQAKTVIKPAETSPSNYVTITVESAPASGVLNSKLFRPTNRSEKIITLAPKSSMSHEEEDEDEENDKDNNIIEIKEEKDYLFEQSETEYLLCGLCGNQFTNLDVLEEHQKTCQQLHTFKEQEIILKSEPIVDEDAAASPQSEVQVPPTSSKVVAHQTLNELIAPIMVNGKAHYKCLICPSTFLSKGNLCLHYNCNHFRKAILELNENNRDRCLSCNEVYSTTQSLIYHIGNGHQLLEKFLNNEDPTEKFYGTQPEVRPGKRLVIENVISLNEAFFPTKHDPNQAVKTYPDKSQLGMTYKELIAPVKVKGKSSFECKLCPISCYSKGNLCFHYTRNHYHEEILKVNDDNQERCISCNKYFESPESLAYHIGLAHRVLEKIVMNENPQENFFKPLPGAKIGKTPTVSEEIVDNDEDDTVKSSSASSNVQTSSPPVISKLKNLSFEELLSPVEINSKLEYRCRICFVTFLSKRNLCLHYCASHYKDFILRLNQNNPDKCISCFKEFQNIQSLIYHIGMGHGVLESIVTKGDPMRVFFSPPPGLKIVPGTSQIIEEVAYEEINFESASTAAATATDDLSTAAQDSKDPRPSSSADSSPKPKGSNLSYEELIAPRMVNNKPEYNCKKCSLSFNTKGNLSLHYNYTHYKEAILKLNRNNYEKCISCNENYTSLQSLVYHIGSGHRVLEKIVNNGDPEKVFFHPPPGKRRAFEAGKVTGDKWPKLCNIKCKICDDRFFDEDDKLIHLASDHFQHELEKFFDAFTDECQVCQAVVVSPKLQLLHLAGCYEDFDQSLLN